MVTDRVGDFIIRLKNASVVKRQKVDAPHSKQLEAIAKKLQVLGFVDAVEKVGDRTLRVMLAYDECGASRIRGVRRLSKPGRRLYISHRDAHKVAGGAGARIISTPKGILSDAEARGARAGGETLFEIW